MRAAYEVLETTPRRGVQEHVASLGIFTSMPSVAGLSWSAADYSEEEDNDASTVVSGKLAALWTAQAVLNSDKNEKKQPS